MKIFATSIQDKKEFKFEEDTLRFKEYLQDKDMYIYERYNWYGRLYAYELVRPVRHKQPDGTIIGRYPSTEEFGQYGLFFPSSLGIERIREKAESWYKELQRNRHRRQN